MSIEEKLAQLTRRLNALEGASSSCAAGPAVGLLPKVDLENPKRLKQSLKQVRSLFEDTEPLFFHVKPEESASTSIVKELIEDLRRMERALEGLEDPRAKVITLLAKTAGRQAEYRLWLRVAANVAPHLSTFVVEAQLTNFWQSQDLTGFTAALQRMEQEQAQIMALRRLADMTFSKGSRKPRHDQSPKPLVQDEPRRHRKVSKAPQKPESGAGLE